MVEGHQPLVYLATGFVIDNHLTPDLIEAEAWRNGIHRQQPIRRATLRYGDGLAARSDDSDVGILIGRKFEVGGFPVVINLGGGDIVGAAAGGMDHLSVRATVNGHVQAETGVQFRQVVRRYDEVGARPQGRYVLGVEPISALIVADIEPIGVDRGHNLIFGQRRLEAHKALGLENIKARMITVPSLLQAEEAENNLRKDFTTSERVAIAAAIKAELGTRQGQRTDLVQGELPENIPEVTGQETRQIIAKKAGFGNETTLRQATIVVEKGDPELIAAMDRGDIAISTAAKLAQRQAAPLVRSITDDVLDPEEVPTDQVAKKRSPPKTWNQKSASNLVTKVIHALNALRQMDKDLLPKDADRLAVKLKGAISRFEAIAAKEVQL